MITYLTPKEIVKQLPVTIGQLKYYRRKGYLKQVEWSPGKRIVKFEVNEVKKVFHLA